MTIRVNGEARAVAAGSSLADVVALVTTAPSGIAVAVNDELVPRASWPTTPVAEGDRVEIVTAMQGG